VGAGVLVGVGGKVAVAVGGKVAVGSGVGVGAAVAVGGAGEIEQARTAIARHPATELVRFMVIPRSRPDPWLRLE
jgi:hypothetical protein